MLEQFKFIPIPPQSDDDIPPQMHPAAIMMGMSIPMNEDVDMTLLPFDEEYCPFDVVRIVFDVATGQLYFSVKEGDRTYGAAFNADGDLLQLQCTSGLGKGSVESTVALYVEQLRIARETMLLVH